jgi:3-oxoacyl-[acyl-carrier protein] reductase
MTMDTNLRDHIVLVTGASGEIGRVIAVQMAMEGARIVGTYYRNRQGAERTAELVQRAGSEMRIEHLSLGDEASTYGLVERVRDAWGPISVLVNNGIAPGWTTYSHEQPIERWNEMITTGLTGTYLCVRACLPDMQRARWGRIVNISSQLASRGSSGAAHYVAAKGGIESLTTTLAIEFAPHGILVNAVEPGFVATEHIATTRAEAITRYASKHPAGRAPTPEDVSRLVVFLGSGANTFVSGETIRVSGGWR